MFEQLTEKNKQICLSFALLKDKMLSTPAGPAGKLTALPSPLAGGEGAVWSAQEPHSCSRPFRPQGSLPTPSSFLQFTPYLQFAFLCSCYWNLSMI